MSRVAVAVLALTLVALAASVCPAAGATAGSGTGARVFLLGRSSDGRAIRATEVGDPNGVRVLVVGCIHGNEPGGIAIARRLERTAPRGVDLWIITVLNPDGRAADTRGNARGVDLNRNFPWRWRPMNGVYESGPRPLSEPEARIAHRLILHLRPHISIWFHQHLDMVWASGGDRSIERRFAQLSGLPYHAMPPLAGSAVSWQNHALPGTTAFAAELPAGRPGPVATARYARAVLTLAHGAQ
ncbi:MAG: murein peptide amidase [Gaiellales bacterium]|nr:murein peptide amidase [Gaiellales bacterium]